MRIAAIYDIHGNVPALEAVLAEIRRERVDGIVVGGDVVPGPMPIDTIDCLLATGIPTQFIQGNGDRETLAWRRGEESSSIPEPYRESMRWVARELRPEDEKLLAGWPSTLRQNITGSGDVFFCHATPANDTDIFTKLTPDDEVARIFGNVDAPIAVCGHTHMQFDRRCGSTRIVNAGSVGMPFGAPGAYWLLLGPEIQLRHTPYDLADAAGRIRRSKYPQAEEFAARNVLQPPSEQDVLTAWSRVKAATA